MTTTTDFSALRTIFHEPARLAIVSALCATDRRTLTFTELKNACNLTDGNLNRHLAVLEEAGAIRVDKAFVDRKPRTTITLTDEGLKRFTDYLAALEDVLEQARRAQQALEKHSIRTRSVVNGLKTTAEA